MLSGERNKDSEKTTVGPISKKATLHLQHTFGTFLCRCVVRLQRETFWLKLFLLNYNYSSVYIPFYSRTH